ncbi:hypothetical protein C8R45DRAFT_402935, partial [Mycena sanguinolenta]
MADKKAMSRALGAAFLNHQVEQLEKSAANANVNWRTRSQPPASPNPKRVNHGGQGKRSSQQQQQPRNTGSNANSNGQRRSFDDPKTSEKEGKILSEKDADIVVVDASVLIHALPAVRAWAHPSRTEVLIVPLEALNTLDLLKKGTSALAQRARAASRVLEAQVGVNERVRVQRDEAFVLWDAIKFETPAATTVGKEGVAATTAVGEVTAALPDDRDAAPEWVRRTVCCARWEVDNAATSTTASTTASSPASPATPSVILAVLAPPSSASDARPLSAGDAAQSKHEPRASGTLVAHWAARAGVVAKRIPAAAPNPKAGLSGAGAAATANTNSGVTATNASGGGGGA